MATVALDELNVMRDSPSSAPAVQATDSKGPTKVCSSLEINNDAPGFFAQGVHNNVATTYSAPSKLNAAKRRRTTLPDVSLKRIRLETLSDSPKRTLARFQSIQLTKDTQKETKLDANIPTGQSKEAINEDARPHEANESEAVHPKQRTPCTLDVLVRCRLEYDLLRERNAVLRVEQNHMIIKNGLLLKEQGQLMAKNAVLRAQQAEMRTKIRDHAAEQVNSNGLRQMEDNEEKVQSEELP
ncbi:hypothetical protein EDC01DRAFT_781540 [Geopyxis carbonaria]|nr:hypothetical protein EDC01DRAFT_781540 [Geopyxis carbonaria]